MRSLIDSDSASLMLAGEQNGQRVVLIPFDLRQSNLPLSAAFPILMSNMLGYLEPANQATQRDLRPGQHQDARAAAADRGDRGAAAGGQSQTFP